MTAARVYAELRRAVLERRQVAATYNGHRRLMCPHVLGTKEGEARCLFYQFGGSSSSGPIRPGSSTNWRCMPVAALEDLRVGEAGAWYGVATTGGQTCIDTIDVEALSRFESPAAATAAGGRPARRRRD